MFCVEKGKDHKRYDSVRTGDAQNAGGTDDRLKVTQLAKTAILNWGMSQSFGFAIPSQLSLESATINNEIEHWLSAAFEDVTALLRANKALLIKVSDVLLEKEELDRGAIDDNG